ncbi:MAG: hypothetical protein A2785_02595 [Candidatus Chisholmbacteria bacterium RIFCSPHIGHO2_01_FULL_49_18]|uniref:Uncharacterized protein n=1 Tax=Candidatus Chisholmbacteria bacterium RIFCSPHIGHO2_01_FULL_49_18 TaxID=1797590 RepID=A0A1G1VL07_9BACT|nr:MAG: hypothetical protein A2785_02595 [Candidatus Chisholmbacteria bacterium RIFCSPHIGHO2_01_FULL_49_18]
MSVRANTENMSNEADLTLWLIFFSLTMATPLIDRPRLREFLFNAHVRLSGVGSVTTSIRVKRKKALMIWVGFILRRTPVILGLRASWKTIMVLVLLTLVDKAKSEKQSAIS